MLVYPFLHFLNELLTENNLKKTIKEPLQNCRKQSFFVLFIICKSFLKKAKLISALNRFTNRNMRYFKI
jgi:hypothetical protein